MTTYQINDVVETENEYGKRKEIRFANGKKQGITPKNKAYSYIPLGYTGNAEIEWKKSKDGKNWFLAKFRPVKGSGTQTQEKSHTSQPAKYKCDPDKLEQGEWIRRHTSWIGCLQCAVTHFGRITPTKVSDISDLANQFYDALCEKVDKPVETMDKPNINPHPTAQAIKEAVNPDENIVESEVEVPF